jgi:hypothetical protein
MVPPGSLNTDGTVRHNDHEDSVAGLPTVVQEFALRVLETNPRVQPNVLLSQVETWWKVAMEGVFFFYLYHLSFILSFFLPPPPPPNTHTHSLIPYNCAQRILAHTALFTLHPTH